MSTAHASPALDQRWLTTRQVEARYSVCSKTLMSWVRLRQFPAPRRLAPNRCLWDAAAILRWEDTALALEAAAGVGGQADQSEAPPEVTPTRPGGATSPGRGRKKQ